jgi:hypothetical protein
MTPPWPAIPLPLIPLFAALSFEAGIIPVIAALAGPVVAYLVAARRFSGKIETTEAADLWRESRDIRKWSRDRIEQLEHRIAHLEDENKELRTRLDVRGDTVSS